MIEPVDGVRHAFHTVRGVRLHVAEAGDPQAPPLLLLHGWPHHWWCWRGVVGPLAGRFRLVMPDWRGMGWSDDATDGVHAPEALEADALALLDVLGVPAAPVIGHDWGCFVGFGLAARHPDRVPALLALSAPHPWVKPDLAVLAGAWRGWYATLNAAGIGTRRTARHVLGDIDGAGVYLERVRRPATTGLYRAYLRILATSAFRRPPPPLRVPVRHLVGDRDVCFSQAIIDAPMPAGPPVEWVRGAGHSLPDTHPRLIADRALELLAG